MQLSQLEKAVFTSLTWPTTSLRPSAGCRAATNRSANPLRRLLCIATSTAGILHVSDVPPSNSKAIAKPATGHRGYVCVQQARSTLRINGPRHW